MPWLLLFIAGLLEVVWAFTMKLSEGFTRVYFAGITLAVMAASFALLAVAMRSLPLGTAYAVWTGIGAAGAFVVGILFLGEAVTPMRLLAVSMIVGGIALMRLSAG